MAVQLKMLGNVVVPLMQGKICMLNVEGFLGCCVWAFDPFLLISSITEERPFTALVTDVQEIWGALGCVCACVRACVRACALACVCVVQRRALAIYEGLLLHPRCKEGKRWCLMPQQIDHQRR